jgi:hypothetical protein
VQVNTLSGDRYELALDRFQEGENISYLKASFVLIDNNRVKCNFQCSWNPTNMDREKARKDFEEAEGVFRYLKNNSPRFDRIVKDRDLEIVLIDNYGMGAIEIAVFRDGEYDWNQLK